MTNAEPRFSMTNMEGFNAKTSADEEVVAFSKPAKSQAGFKSELPADLDKIRQNLPNLNRADTAGHQTRSKKNFSNQLTPDACAVSQPDIQEKLIDQISPHS